MEFLANRQDLRNVDVQNEWKLLLTKKEIKKCIRKCARVIQTKFTGKDFVLTYILKGAAYFFVDLSREITIPHSIYSIEASSYHNSQTQDEQVKVFSDRIVPSKFTGKKVVLIDELYDSGKTIEQVKQTIHEKAGVPLEDIFTCTLFNKNKTKKPDLYGIDVPNVWLVGYGLDDNQEKRNWTYLYACPKCSNLPKTPEDKIFDDEEFYKMVRNGLEKAVMNN